MKSKLLALVHCFLVSVILLPAQIKNASFESDIIQAERQIAQKLKAWKVTSGNVALILSKIFPVAHGNQVLDLNGDQAGSIMQTITGLRKSSDCTLKIEYADQKGRERNPDALLATANVLINRITVSGLSTLSAAPDYIDGMGFPFQSSLLGTRGAAFQQYLIRALQWLSGNEVDNYVESDFPTSEEIALRAPIPDEFDQLDTAVDWKLQFADQCTGNWRDNWFLDGQLAKIENSEKGMNFTAGPVNRNDAHHAVLWTKASFKGDVKIEYNYTRTDSQIINVNILFIQATGIGGEAFDQDITKWNDYRKVPAMSKYWRNMKLIHISYAAFPMINEDPENDYIRVRRYPATEAVPFKDTEVPPTFERTGLFLPNLTYRITWIKTGGKLFLKVDGDGKIRQYNWDLTAFAPVTEGRIGLRHMFTRSAQYSDFKVYCRTAQ